MRIFARNVVLGIHVQDIFPYTVDVLLVLVRPR
jgi:hypothetical protein